MHDSSEHTQLPVALAALACSRPMTRKRAAALLVNDSDADLKDAVDDFNLCGDGADAPQPPDILYIPIPIPIPTLYNAELSTRVFLRSATPLATVCHGALLSAREGPWCVISSPARLHGH